MVFYHAEMNSLTQISYVFMYHALIYSQGPLNYASPRYRDGFNYASPRFWNGFKRGVNTKYYQESYVSLIGTHIMITLDSLQVFIFINESSLTVLYGKINWLNAKTQFIAIIYCLGGSNTKVKGLRVFYYSWINSQTQIS